MVMFSGGKIEREREREGNEGMEGKKMERDEEQGENKRKKHVEGK